MWNPWIGRTDHINSFFPMFYIVLRLLGKLLGKVYLKMFVLEIYFLHWKMELMMWRIINSQPLRSSIVSVLIILSILGTGGDF
jgi:hypothetical protein